MKESDLILGNYTKLLLPIPQVKELSDWAKEEVKKEIAEYIELPNLEGILIRWKDWYWKYLGADFSTFRVRLERKIREVCDLQDNEEIQAIEFMDTENLEWLDLTDRIVYNEVMSNRYIIDEGNHVDIYRNYVRWMLDYKLEEAIIDLPYILSTEKEKQKRIFLGPLLPAWRKIIRRGFLEGSKAEKEILEMIE